MSSPYADLFADALPEFDWVRAELGRHGVAVDPAMTLRRGPGMLWYFDRSDGQLYISMPDSVTPMGILQAAFYRDLFGLEDHELARMIRLQLPMMLAHELAHYLRHQHGRFGDDRWFEEQVANRLGCALTASRLHPGARQALISLLQRCLIRLAARGGEPARAVASFLEPERALAVAEQVPGASGHAQPELREHTIAAFNHNYTNEFIDYVQLQFGWMLIELLQTDRPRVDDVLREHFGIIDYATVPGCRRGRRSSASARCRRAPAR